MAEGGFTNSEQILEGILTGQVPRQIRLFAAQGLLPISREELFRLQTVLTADPDEELAKMATASLKEVETEVLVEWLSHGEVSPIELDLLVRSIRDEPVWAAVAQHSNISDETLCMLARNSTPLVQDIIITNQVRMLGCLEILDNVRSNPQVTKVILRRVREFEEEFIEKAAAAAMAEVEEPEEDIEETPSIENEVNTLKAIGGNIPSEEELSYESVDDPALEEAVAKGGSAFSRIVTMGVKEKIILGIRGTREERAILIRSRNRMILRAVLSSPKITDSEIEKFASSRSVAEEVIRIITQNPRYLRKYAIVCALVFNAKTPVMAALRLMGQLSPKDLTALTKDHNASHVIRRRAKEFAKKRRL